MSLYLFCSQEPFSTHFMVFYHVNLSMQSANFVTIIRQKVLSIDIHHGVFTNMRTLQLRHNGHDGVQIAGISIVYSTVYSVAYQGKHQTSVSLSFVGWIQRRLVDSPHEGQWRGNVPIWWRHHGEDEGTWATWHLILPVRWLFKSSSSSNNKTLLLWITERFCCESPHKSGL